MCLPVVLAASTIHPSTHPIHDTQIIKKSRFVTRACPAASFAEAQAFLREVSDLKATHNCWGWRGQEEERSSDDGEPGGTAGRPILSAIESEELCDVMVVVTRYVVWVGGWVGGKRGFLPCAFSFHASPVGGLDATLPSTHPLTHPPTYLPTWTTGISVASSSARVGSCGRMGAWPATACGASKQ